ncbi:MAG: glycosyltransferase [Cyclonatronaceae bacterium]
MNLIAAHSFPVWLPQTQTWLYNQVRFLPKDITSHILCKETRNLDQFRLPSIHSLSGPSSRLTRLSTRLFRHVDFHLFTRYMCRRIGPDILHSHFGPVGWKNHRVLRPFASSRLRKIRQVVTFYGQDVDHLPRVDPDWIKRYREMFDEVDMVLCEGPFMAGKVAELGCPKDRLRIHHLGVDLERIPFELRPWRNGEPFRILMAAAFRPKKGLLYGFRALEQLSFRFDLHITLVGDSTGDPTSNREKQRLMDYLRSSPISDHVTLTGFISSGQLIETARQHHIYLAPSVTADDGDSEGGAPVSLIEMAASGLPVVSSRHCDIPGVIIHGETGLLAGERDVDEIAACLEQLMAEPQKWPVMTRKARRHIEKNFDAGTQGAELSKIYQEIHSR